MGRCSPKNAVNVTARRRQVRVLAPDDNRCGHTRHNASAGCDTSEGRLYTETVEH